MYAIANIETRYLHVTRIHITVAFDLFFKKTDKLNHHMTIQEGICIFYPITNIYEQVLNKAWHVFQLACTLTQHKCNAAAKLIIRSVLHVRGVLIVHF